MEQENDKPAGHWADDLLWGGEAIAAEIGRPAGATFHLLETRMLPARKVGGRWVASRRALRAHFENLMSEVA